MLQLLGWCGQTGGMDAMQWFSDDLMIFRPPGLTANELVSVEIHLCAERQEFICFSVQKRGLLSHRLDETSVGCNLCSLSWVLNISINW